MHWQDWVLTAGSLVFTIALIPSVMGKDKPAISTSLSTAIVLFVFAAVYISLALWFSAFTVSITGLMWLTLAVQKHNQTPR